MAQSLARMDSCERCLIAGSGRAHRSATVSIARMRKSSREGDESSERNKCLTSDARRSGVKEARYAGAFMSLPCLSHTLRRRPDHRIPAVPISSAPFMRTDVIYPLMCIDEYVEMVKDLEKREEDQVLSLWMFVVWTKPPVDAEQICDPWVLQTTAFTGTCDPCHRLQGVSCATVTGNRREHLVLRRRPGCEIVSGVSDGIGCLGHKL